MIKNIKEAVMRRLVESHPELDGLSARLFYLKYPLEDSDLASLDY